jgi:hypothetical protein
VETVKPVAASLHPAYLVVAVVAVDTSAVAAVAADLPVLLAALVTTKVAAAAEPEVLLILAGSAQVLQPMA